MHSQRISDERGMALIIAVFALVVIGALVIGAFFIGQVEQRSGTNTVYATQAGEAADAGINWAIANWQPAYTNMAMPSAGVPSVISLGARSLPDQPQVVNDVQLRRLNQSLYLLSSTGRRVRGGQVLASRTTGTLMRISKPTVDVNGAVTVTKPVKLNGNAFLVTGENAVPGGWGDCAAPDAGTSDDLVGIRSATTSGLTSQDENNVAGYPDNVVEHDTTITSETFRDFLDETFESLTWGSDTKSIDDDTPKTPAPVADNSTSPATCDKSQPFNFGEPSRLGTPVTACYDYFPVVHGTDDRTKFSGGRGQGTLLIDGDLEIAGGFEWSGLVIVRGAFKVTGTGNKITGALLAEGVSLDGSSLGGNVEIHYSQCAVQKAVDGASSPMPLGQRSWAQLY